MKLWLAIFLVLSNGAVLAKGGEAESKILERTIMGWLEPTVVAPATFIIRAKLDTGAKTSSLHARNVEIFNRQSRQWVRFIVDDLSAKTGGKAAAAVTFERPLARVAKVKRLGQEAASRPVVTLPFCLNGQQYESEFTLIDRAGFNYPMLLGRGFLKDVALVDPSSANLTRDNLKDCRGGGELPDSDALPDDDE